MANQTDGNGWPASLTGLPTNWLESCQGLSSTAQAMVERWVQNRTEQVQATLDACAKLASCKSPSEIAAIQQRWWQGTVDQLNAEMKSYQEQVLALAHQSPASPPASKPASRRA